MQETWTISRENLVDISRTRVDLHDWKREFGKTDSLVIMSRFNHFMLFPTRVYWFDLDGVLTKDCIVAKTRVGKMDFEFNPRRSILYRATLLAEPDLVSVRYAITDNDVII